MCLISKYYLSHYKLSQTVMSNMMKEYPNVNYTKHVQRQRANDKASSRTIKIIYRYNTNLS